MSLVPDDELAKLVREEPAGARDRKEEAPGVDHPAPQDRARRERAQAQGGRGAAEPGRQL